MAPRVKNYFVDKKEMFDKVKEYKLMVAYARKRELPTPPVPPSLSQDVYNIAENLSRRHNFIGYPFREDMIQTAVRDCLNYMHTFDTEKYDNPFGWVTRVSWNSFLGVIIAEKRQLYLKYKQEQQALHEFTFLVDGGPEVSLNDSEYINNYIAEYERSAAEKAANQVKPVVEEQDGTKDVSDDLFY